MDSVVFAPKLGVKLSAMRKTDNGLYIEDIKEGTGKKLVAPAQATVAYTGWLPNGTQFDASQGVAFMIGAGQLIPGWDQGIPEMKVGGKRRLVVPPELAYGAAGSPPTIPPNSALVFEVTLISVP